eukprot:g670.t1
MEDPPGNISPTVLPPGIPRVDTSTKRSASSLWVNAATKSSTVSASVSRRGRVFAKMSAPEIVGMLPGYLERTDRYIKRLESELRQNQRHGSDTKEVEKLRERVASLEQSLRLQDLVGYACFLSGHKAALSAAAAVGGKKQIPGPLCDDGSLRDDIMAELKDVFGAHLIETNAHHANRQVRLCMDRTSISPTLQQHSGHGPDNIGASMMTTTSHAIRRASYISSQDWQKKERDGCAERYAVLKELLQTEELYHKYLGVIVDHFKRPLVSMTESLDPDANGKVPRESLRDIFFNIEELRAVSKDLIDDLRGAMDSSMGHKPGSVLQCQSVAALFNVARFEAFVKFVANASKMQRRLTQMLKGSAEFAKFCARVSEGSDVMNGLHLSDLLIMPVQRLPRYSLFIKDLMNTISEKHQKQSGLQLAMVLLKDVGRKVEEYANMGKLRELQERFGRSGVRIVKKGRRLVSEGALTKMGRFFSTKRYLVLLFNDKIMFYEEGSDEIAHQILLQDVIDVQLVPRVNSKGFEMIVQPFASAWANDGVLAWEADNKYERTSWVNTLLHLIDSHEVKRASIENSTNAIY